LLFLKYRILFAIRVTVEETSYPMLPVQIPPCSFPATGSSVILASRNGKTLALFFT